MENNYNLNEEEQLKAENDFLKMKIMLEHGAEFFNPEGQDTEFSLETENEFLNHIVEFEKQAHRRKKIAVFEKIGKPQHFKPVNEIPDDIIRNEWKKLLEYIQQHGIDLSVCSPKVSARELYRFTTEELYKYETDDINIPGMMSIFIYDEFYPDCEYDNTCCAVDCCIELILRKKPMEFTHWFAKENIRFNTCKGLTEKKLKQIINKFKDKFDKIELKEINNVSCLMQEENCTIKGTHETTLVFDNVPVNTRGNWLVEFILLDDFWVITNVQIEGIKF